MSQRVRDDAGLLQEFVRPTLLNAISDALRPYDDCRRFAVALSGGPDSAMLAVHAAEYARRSGQEMHVFHIHHGLQAPADGWRNRVHDLAQRLGVACHSWRVTVNLRGGDGMESAARDARYRALAELAHQTGVRCILLGHHRNDQVETLLLRLLRGAGPAALAAMEPAVRRDGVDYLRPWLDVDRACILELARGYFALSGWAAVDDPTNSNERYTRGAVRELLVPPLNQRWPGWQATLARHARQSAEVGQVLNEVAASDFSTLSPSPDGLSFSLLEWRRLSPARQALALRYWLAQAGLRMPTDARLQDIMRQLRGLHQMGSDRQMRVKHGDACVRCAKGRVFLELRENP